MSGLDVFIDTDLAETTTLESGRACQCHVQTQRGKQVSVKSYFAGPQRSNCGTSVDFTGRAIGYNTILSTPCYSYNFHVATHTYTNMSVALRRNYEPYSSPYCIHFSLSKYQTFGILVICFVATNVLLLIYLFYFINL